LFDDATPGLNRQLAGLQLAHEFESGARVGAGVVVAEQQFAAFGFGSEQIDNGERMRLLGNESSTAAGVRLNYTQPFGEQISVQAALQSKIDMQPFQSYRGVFSDPGDFDIPAEAEISARVALSPAWGITVGTQHVMYSELKAFSSYALPERFLSLLGDGTSPVFAWRDLTVYNLALDYALGRSSRIDLRYSTQQQPEPSSALLFDALREEFTDRNVAIGVTHRFDRAGELRLAASHAPVEYFLGNTSALGRGDAGGDQFEFEARWRVEF
jgi:long-subunit fatty acid transport protein